MAEENNEQIIEDDPIEVRRAKREALLAEGKNRLWSRCIRVLPSHCRLG